MQTSHSFLVVRHRDPRNFSEEIEEALEIGYQLVSTGQYIVDPCTLSIEYWAHFVRKDAK